MLRQKLDSLKALFEKQPNKLDLIIYSISKILISTVILAIFPLSIEAINTSMQSAVKTYCEIHQKP